MASSSGTSSGSLISQQEDQLQQIMDIRKRKRMISNRESARRSRMRKQKHLDELATQVNELRNENNQILTNMNLTTQLFLNIEAENSVLRAQISELSHRLQSLNDIINCLTTDQAPPPHDDPMINIINGTDDHFLNPWNLLYVNQPIMASADAFMY